MANKVITVTDPSIVTNDTLAGYNNYSDIDGQLGTTMTPTEATNGKTITLSDGVVHEVTTKPVGTTNGEFSAVVSNAVTVDLSSGGLTPITFATSEGLTKVDELYTDSTGVAYDGRATGGDEITGDFTMEVDISTLSEKGMMFGFKLSDVNDRYDSGTSTNNLRYGAMWQNSSNELKAVYNGGPITTDIVYSPIPTVGEKIGVKKVGDTLSIYRITPPSADEVLLHTFAVTNTNSMWTFISAFTNNNVNEPRGG